MTGRLKIKVIKKGEAKPAVAPKVTESKTKREAAREMVSNVSNWVSDFQSRKRGETKIAIEKLFGQQPQPNEL
jgi:hypothetical protein